MHTHKISYYHKIQKTKENLEKGEYKKLNLKSPTIYGYS